MVEKMMLQSSGIDIPDQAIERIDRCLLPKIQAFFEKEATNNNDHSDASVQKVTVSDKNKLIA